MKKILYILVAALVALALMAGGASADRLLTGKDIKDGTIRTADIRDGGVKAVDLSVPVRNQLYKVGSSGEQGPKGDTGAAGPRGPAGAAATDRAGVLDQFVADEVTIANIGGPFAQRATKVGSFDLAEGVWLVNLSGNFDRIDNSQSSSPILQLATRSTVGPDADLTAWTGNYPAIGDREQSASMSQIVYSDGNLPVDVYVFGYNNDGSSAGSGNYTADVEVSVIRVDGPMDTRHIRCFRAPCP